MKHSPIPWTFDHEVRGCRSIRCNRPEETPEGCENEVCCTPGLADDDEDYANACLIASAPDLLTVLKEAWAQIIYLHWKFGETASGNNVLAKIDAVITEAEP